jgi:hypothetical protein
VARAYGFLSYFFMLAHRPCDAFHALVALVVLTSQKLKPLLHLVWRGHKEVRRRFIRQLESER